MKTINSFSITRITLLAKQYFIYNSKLIFTSLFGFVAGLFVLLFSIQIITEFANWNAGHFFYVFATLFMVGAIAYAGSSFAGLRSKERSYNYLIQPATTLEKFLFELVTRIILFAVIMPLLYWVIFNLEGYLIQWLNSDFTFQSFGFFDPFHLRTEAQTRWMIIFTSSEALLFLTVPFFGATAFTKQPIIKTVAWAVGILAVHLIIFFLLHNNNLGLARTPIGKYFENPESGLMLMTSYVMMVNIALVVLAYYKLKRKEV
ncbi:MAG: hypothetical protein ACR2MX_04745 [Cyclobacteriaceae bacterium]